MASSLKQWFSRLMCRLGLVGDKDSTDLCKMRKIRTMQEFFEEELIYPAVMYSEIVYSFIF